MNGKICIRCRKPMGNLLHTVRLTEGKGFADFDIHSRCMEGICLGCVSMIVGKYNGVCSCGNEWKLVGNFMEQVEDGLNEFEEGGK